MSAVPLQSLVTSRESYTRHITDEFKGCDKCGSVCTETMAWRSEGQVLLHQLKRFDVQEKSDGSYTPIKIDAEVQINESLVFKGDAFECIALVQHIGIVPRSGHYVAFVRSQSGGDSTRWTKCDDDKLEEVSWTHVAAQEGYLLAYVRRSTPPAIHAVPAASPAPTCEGHVWASAVRCDN